MGGAASAWVAAERNRLLGRELLPEEKAQHADKEKAAKIKELDAWKKFDVFQLGSECIAAARADVMGPHAEDGEWFPDAMGPQREKRRGAIGGEGLPEPSGRQRRRLWVR